MNINFDSDMYKKLQAKATDLPPGLDTTVS